MATENLKEYKSSIAESWNSGTLESNFDKILEKDGYKKMTVEECKKLSKERMGDMKISDIIRQMRDEGY